MKNGVKKADADYIFELVDKFAGYGFNKSHAAAYAVVSYHTAYLKANFREEFLAASMTLEMGNTDKLAMYTSEARKSGITILPPCVNASEVDFLAGENTIRYSLAALKNIGAQAVESLVAERTARGPSRTSPILPAAATPSRSTSARWRRWQRPAPSTRSNQIALWCMATLSRCSRSPTGMANNEAQGITDLFGGGSEARPQLDIRPVKAWTPMERLQHEFEAVGFFLSGHPLDAYAGVLAKLGIFTYAELEARADRGVVSGRLAGVVVSSRERRSQKGNKFAFAMFSEPTGQFEAVIFSETLGAEPAAARTGHGRADLRRGRARWRHSQVARAGDRIAG